MRFKAGDKVKIVRKSGVWCRSGQMDKWLGKIMTVDSISSVGYFMKEDSGENGGLGWCWSEKCLEPCRFTKADLKPCMVVELRNKWIARIEEVKGGLCVSVVNKETDWSELCDYNEDLTYAWARDKSWDIMKVYGFCDYGCGKYLLNTENRELLWERIEKSPQQIKLEELENKQREIADEIRKIREEM